MKVTTSNLDTLNRALVNAPQPSQEQVARYGDAAKALWRKALIDTGVIERQGDAYTYDSVVLQDHFLLIWATVYQKFAADLADWLTLPAQAHSDTSLAAGASMITHAETLRSMVYEALAAKPMTDIELVSHLGLSENSIRPRRIELAHKGLVESIGKKKTPSGRMANIWGVKR